jgi:hypothetical protein
MENAVQEAASATVAPEDTVSKQPRTAYVASAGGKSQSLLLPIRLYGPFSFLASPALLKITSIPVVSPAAPFKCLPIPVRASVVNAAG